jgi:4-aminobutyrate aminotransferase-like enzyme
MHTSTFMGHPTSCAAALASIGLIEELGLAPRAREEGARWLDELRRMAAGRSVVREVRGRGMMIGVQLGDPAGSPPLTIERDLLDLAVEAVDEVLAACEATLLPSC